MLENCEVIILCPKCGNETNQKFGRLKKIPDLPCVACGHNLTAQRKELVGRLQKGEDLLEDDVARIRRGES